MCPKASENAHQWRIVCFYQETPHSLRKGRGISLCMLTEQMFTIYSKCKNKLKNSRLHFCKQTRTIPNRKNSNAKESTYSGYLWGVELGGREKEFSL